MHILVAIDRSKESQNALVNALDIVNTFEGEVTAVHAVPPVEDGSDSDEAGTDGADPEAIDRGREILEEVTERALQRDISVETELLVGDPIQAITAYAEAHGADTIYVGHRGLSREGKEFSGESRGPLGSVSKGLVEHTEVPVTVFDRGL